MHSNVIKTIQLTTHKRKARTEYKADALPTMSFLICSVMGMGLAASGETYLVKMFTASLSIPGNVREYHFKNEKDPKD